jgi:hypothetical protein
VWGAQLNLSVTIGTVHIIQALAEGTDFFGNGETPNDGMVLYIRVEGCASYITAGVVFVVIGCNAPFQVYS